MYFSKAINGFIPQEWIDDGTYAKLPADAVELTDSEVAKFYKSVPPVGKELGVIDGRLAWVDLPPATIEELIADAEQKRAQLRAVADSEIGWRQDAVSGGIATEEEAADLAAWAKYRVLLMRVNTAAPAWPTLPAL